MGRESFKYLSVDKDEVLSGNRKQRNCHARDLISFVAAKSMVRNARNGVKSTMECGMVEWWNGVKSTIDPCQNKIWLFSDNLQ